MYYGVKQQHHRAAVSVSVPVPFHCSCPSLDEQTCSFIAPDPRPFDFLLVCAHGRTDGRTNVNEEKRREGPDNKEGGEPRQHEASPNVCQ